MRTGQFLSSRSDNETGKVRRGLTREFSPSPVAKETLAAVFPLVPNEVNLAKKIGLMEFLAVRGQTLGQRRPATHNRSL